MIGIKECEYTNDNKKGDIMGELNMEKRIKITREEIEMKIKELQRLKYTVPSVRLVNIPFRGNKKQIKLINYDKEKHNLGYIIKRLGRAMSQIDDCEIIIKDNETIIKVKGKRKIVAREMVTEYGTIELNEKNINNNYVYNYPIIGEEEYEYEGDIHGLEANYVTVDNNFNILE